ncbi:MAG TPA: maleylpyruvate isomerase family mycothiol-dependent enzyme [Acidimicrobiales bacterium]|nr:maleylpyruvate isomerase family mycothiol-dependent enzyme [Acidimicrobiales bacterium]
MRDSGLLSTAEVDAWALLVAAETDWRRRVPHCPEWDTAGLIRHTGGILMWMAAIVISGERVSRRELEPAPEDPADLPAWYAGNLDQTLAALRAADPDAITWTFSSTGDRRVSWWCRRLAVEVAIHRWDAQHALAADGSAGPMPLDGDVARAGIEEFVIEFLPGLLAQEGVQGLAGTFHLRATDEPEEWWMDLDGGGLVRPRHATVDSAISATRSDLLLWLTNRGPLNTLEVSGNRQVLDHWRQLQR